jgi:hypothetical protein
MPGPGPAGFGTGEILIRDKEAAGPGGICQSGPARVDPDQDSGPRELLHTGHFPWRCNLLRFRSRNPGTDGVRVGQEKGGAVFRVLV